MKTYKIVGYKIKHADSELLSKGLEKYPQFELNLLPSFDEMALSDENVVAFFLYVDESVSHEELEQILKKHHTKNINIILKNKNFDYLMTCYRHNATSVFEESLSQTYLTRTLIQIDLKVSKSSVDFPVGPVMELFASPVKIKSDHELYTRLSHYFCQFEKVKFFDMISCHQNDLSLISGAKLTRSLSQISFPDVPDSYIGFEFSATLGGRYYTLTPLMVLEGKALWLLLEIAPEHKSFVMNKLFYKFLENVHIYRMNKEKEQNLMALATTDDVTGLYNQRKLSQDLASAVDYHERESKNFSIMFIDVDHFKSVNDNYGHVTGSKLLQDIGEELSHLLRSSDDIYRYGGDEFVVIMPSVNIQTVHEIATRILAKIKSKKFDVGDGTDFHLSVSIGIAQYPTDATSAIEIIRFADEMMYQSKKSGRGKVFHIKEVQIC